MDQDGKRQTASAIVTAPFGLRPSDEMFLWGMLGLTLAQQQVSAELLATPYFILKSLGCIDSAGDRGGSAYKAFRESLRRLAVVTYQCNAFYDPSKGEHRETAFGFLSYSLPTDPASNRAWRIIWDPLFLEYCSGARGCLSFDMAIYRTLDPAARRLYLFLAKIFWRKQWTHWIDLRNLAVDVLGFSPTVAIRNLKQKVKRAILRLADHGIIDLVEGTDARNLFVDRDQGGCMLQLKRGQSFRRLSQNPDLNAITALTIYDPLKSIGLDDAAIARIVRTFPQNLIQQWADITLAARERQGRSFFKKSPQAYFVDNLRQAAENGRTPPDWWWACKREEEQRIDSSLAHRLLAQVSIQSKSAATPGDRHANSFLTFLRGDGRQEFESLLQPIFADLCRGGMPADQAHKQATQLCVDHLRRRFIAA